MDFVLNGFLLIKMKAKGTERKKEKKKVGKRLEKKDHKEEIKKKSPKILVFCAHPDDQIFGPGGTIARYAKEGKKIYTYIFSYGEMYPIWVKQKINIGVRVKEAQDADKVIGGSGVTFFGLKEGQFFKEYQEKKLNEKIKRILLQKNPEKIFIHSINDPHPDHKAIYTIITSLVDVLGLKTEIYSFDVWNPINFRERNEPKMFVDISKTFKLKLKALHCFRSQQVPLLFLLWSVYVRGFINGIRSSNLVAERFIKVK